MSETKPAGIVTADGAPEEEEEEPEIPVADQVTEIVMSGRAHLPPMPEVARRARDMLAKGQVSTRELGRLLTADPGIAAALLRLANSAHYGGLGRVATVDMAVQRIGMQEVGAMITALSVKGYFDHPSPMEKALLRILWDHSVTTAFAGRAIAREVGVDTELAFLGGLLHDCGKIIVLDALHQLSEEQIKIRPTRSLMIELMDELHLEFGHRLLSSWNVEIELADLAREHEEPQPEPSDLLLSVQAANLITRKLGFHFDPAPDLVLGEHPIIQDLGLEDMTIATLMIDMEDHLNDMRKLF